MRKSPLVLLLLVAVAHADDNTPKSLVIESVAAVVNDRVILQSEVIQRATPMLEADQAQLDQRSRVEQWRTITRTMLDQMIDEELIVAAGVEAKLEVSEDEVTKALAEVKRQNHVTDKQLEAALAQQGYSVTEYKKDMKRQIMRMRAVNVLVRPRVNVSEEDLKSHYDKLSGQSATVTQVHLRHILVALPDKPTNDEMEAARRRAGELVARARAGEDFAGLAKANTQDAATKESGGDLGWYKRGELPTEWEEVLFAMAPTEVRGPVRGPRGVHVFQVLENKSESVRAFAEVKDQLREQLFNEAMERQTKSWVQELRRKAHVEVKM